MGNAPNYRGTYRAHPTFCDALPTDYEINRLFFWFLEEGGELGVVSNLSKALRFAELWNARLSAPDLFEVVEVTDGQTSSETDTRLMGFDISAGYNYSLLSWGLQVPKGVQRLDWRIQNLYELMSRYYRPQLNANGLFETADEAASCLGTLKALQGYSPDLFESGDLGEFRVNGLYRVLEKTQSPRSLREQMAREGA